MALIVLVRGRLAPRDGDGNLSLIQNVSSHGSGRGAKHVLWWPQSFLLGAARRLLLA